MLEFEWDDANRRHIALHNVTEDEAEESFKSNTLELAFDITDDEERIDEVGATMRGRILRIVTILRENRIRVVTAFDAPKAMKLAHLMEKGVRYD